MIILSQSEVAEIQHQLRVLRENIEAELQATERCLRLCSTAIATLEQIADREERTPVLDPTLRG